LLLPAREVAEQLRLRRGVAAAELLRQRVVQRSVVALKLPQEPLDRHAHQLRSAERRHVRKYVRRVQTLAADVQLQGLDKRRGDPVKHLGAEVVLDEQPHVALDARVRQARGGGNDIQRVMPPAIGHVPTNGLFDREVEELLQEDRPGHRIQLLGRAADGGMKVLCEFADRHQVENLRAEQPRPVLSHVPDRHGGEHALGRIEQVFLSRIDSISHLIRNLRVSRCLEPLHVYQTLMSDAREKHDKT